MGDQEQQAEQTAGANPTGGVSLPEDIRTHAPWSVQTFAAVYGDNTNRYMLYGRLVGALALVILSTMFVSWVAAIVVATYAIYLEKEVMVRAFMQQQVFFLFSQIQLLMEFARQSHMANKETSERVDMFNKRLSSFMAEQGKMATPGQLGN